MEHAGRQPCHIVGETHGCDCGMQQKSRHCSTWTLLGLLLPPKKSVSHIIKGYFGSQLCGKKAFSDGWLSLQPMACWLYCIFSQFSSSLWRVPFLLPLGGHVSMDRMARCLLKAVVSVSEGPVCCMGEYTTAYFCVCLRVCMRTHPCLPLPMKPAPLSCMGHCPQNSPPSSSP